MANSLRGQFACTPECIRAGDSVYNGRVTSHSNRLALFLAVLSLGGSNAGRATAQIEAEFSDEIDIHTQGQTGTPPAPAPATPASTAAPVPASAEPVEAPPPASQVDDGREPAEGEPPPETRDAQRLRMQNSFGGPVGGFHLVDGGSGPPGTFRLQLGIDAFTTSDFLVANDVNDRVGGTISLSWTAIEALEIYGALGSHANYNDHEDPQLLQVLGDATLGFKVFTDLTPFLFVSGDARAAMLHTVGDLGPVFSAISYGLRAAMSVDLRQVESPVPLIGRLNIDYFFDNSSNLVEDLENQRYDMLGADRLTRREEQRHLIRRVERFALGINRVDMFTLALGVEAPLRVADEFFLHPLLEWSLGIPVNRQGYSCLLVQTNSGPADTDGCLDVEGIAAMPSNLTLGVRVFPPVRGLSLGLGFDIGLTGTSVFVRELAGNAPWSFLFALSYAVDPRAQPAVAQPVEVVREVVRPEPPKPRVQGQVVDSGTGSGVANAVVRYPGLDFSAQQSDASGTFVSYGLEPGEARFEVSHPDYEGRLCVVEIPQTAIVRPTPTAPAPGAPAAPGAPGSPEAGGGPTGPAPTPAPALNPYLYGGRPATAPEGAEQQPEFVAMRCELTAKPRQGGVRGSVLGVDNSPVVGARVSITGPSSQELVTDSMGQFTAQQLATGSYNASVDADAFLMRIQSFEVKPAEQTALQIVLEPKPKEAAVQLTKEEVKIRKEIFFKTNSAEISEKSNALLAEIADVLLRNPQVKVIEVQGHTDATGTTEGNIQLSQQRAEAVRNALIASGVAETRMTAKGYGDNRPLVPNLTERHRARNRRVQFIIREQE